MLHYENVFDIPESGKYNRAVQKQNHDKKCSIFGSIKDAIFGTAPESEIHAQDLFTPDQKAASGELLKYLQGAGSPGKQAAYKGELVAPLTGAEQISLSGLEERARLVANQGEPAYQAAGTALIDILTKGPTDQNSIKSPLLEAFMEAKLQALNLTSGNTIDQKAASGELLKYLQGAGSPGKQAAYKDEKAIEDLVDTMLEARKDVFTPDQKTASAELLKYLQGTGSPNKQATFKGDLEDLIDTMADATAKQVLKLQQDTNAILQALNLTPGNTMSLPTGLGQRHKTFVSYHHAKDQYYRDQFEALFHHHHDIMVSQSVRMGDIDPYLKTETVRQKIRDEYLRDSTVTVVLIGSQTWQRKHVDWEIGSSIRHTQHNLRSGLLGIVLPSYPRQDTSKYDRHTIPPRLFDNINRGYAEIYNWSDDPATVQGWIHEAFNRRRTVNPDNSYETFANNRSGARW